MDPKKQDLSPELKEVYERVMNTQAPAGAPPPAQNPTPQPVVAPPAAPAAQPTPAATPAPEAPKPQENAQPVTPAAPGPASFSFSGNKMSTPQGTTSTTGKKKIPPFAIPAGVVVLVIAWAALWAKIFGLF